MSNTRSSYISPRSFIVFLSLDPIFPICRTPFSPYLTEIMFLSFSRSPHFLHVSHIPFFPYLTELLFVVLSHSPHFHHKSPHILPIYHRWSKTLPTLSARCSAGCVSALTSSSHARTRPTCGCCGGSVSSRRRCSRAARASSSGCSFFF